MSTNRRKFLKQFGGTTALLTTAGLSSLAQKERAEQILVWENKKLSANDRINVAVVGCGIMGFQDVASAVSVSGVKLVAASDLYSGRLTRIKELYGNDVFTTRHYEDILNRKDVDAVIVATSDNWHSKICIDALKAGKAVYGEKPVVHKLDQGLELINTYRQTQKVMQVGSQGISSIAFAKAKELFEQGEIGQINSVEAAFNRQSALGAWEYTIPSDASPVTVDWERYQQLADKKFPWDEKRFFWWRNYREYGTGVAGDLFVHLLTGLHYVTSAKGPDTIYSIGDLTYWKDGRNVPDVMTSVLHYPASDKHAAFQVTLRVNFVSGEGETGYTKIIGSDGVMQVDGSGVTVSRRKMSVAPGIGGWDALSTYPKAMQERLLSDYDKKYSAEEKKAVRLPDLSFSVPEDYNTHAEHFKNFFLGMRNDKTMIEDPEFGFRAAAPCLCCNESYFENKVIHWDAERMKRV